MAYVAMAYKVMACIVLARRRDIFVPCCTGDSARHAGRRVQVVKMRVRTHTAQVISIDPGGLWPPGSAVIKFEDAGGTQIVQGYAWLPIAGQSYTLAYIGVGCIVTAFFAAHTVGRARQLLARS